MSAARALWAAPSRSAGGALCWAPVECPEAPTGSPDGTSHGRKYPDSVSGSGWPVRGADVSLASFPGGPSLLPPSPLQPQGLP